MKNKFLKFIIIISTILIVISFPYKTVTADSGFDTDYSGSWDSGSWDSGSSWGSDSSWDSGSHGGSDGDAVVEVLFILIFSLISAFLAYEERQIVKNGKNYFKNALTEEEIHNLDSSLDIEEFKKKVYESFVNLQVAWMNFDYDKIRNLVTDELFNTYSMQLNTLSTKGQKNIMQDFVFNNFAINKIEVQNNIQSIEVLLSVSFKDYIVNNNGLIVRGNSDKVYNMVYSLTYVKTINTNINKCSNCGAELNQVASNICPYCKSTIVSNSYNYVLSKKTKLNQN